MSGTTNKRETFRVHMGWLHSWAGLVAGLVLVCIFATGTLSVFDTEITHWMQPEIPLSTPITLTETALNRAASVLQSEQKNGYAALLSLPSSRDPVLRVVHYNGHAFVGPALAPSDGHSLPTRPTAGGQFFFTFHFTLYSGPFIGSTLVCLLGLALLAILGAGVAIHVKALWPNLILFRPFGAQPRAWLDAHLLTGILFLPFLIMITYTGTIILARGIFPVHPLFVQQAPLPAKPAQPPKNAEQTPHNIPPLLPLINQAKVALNTPACSFILFSSDEIRIAKSSENSVRATRDMAIFSRKDGRFLRTVVPQGSSATATGLVHGLHFARFSSPLLCWLYFASGLACTGMMAAGLILFFMKRRRTSGTTLAFRLGEGLTISTITGLTIAILGFFLTSRILPITLANYSTLEVNLFFGLWALATLHALACSLCHKPSLGWQGQCTAILALSLFVPCVDALTTPHDWAHDARLYAASYALFLLTALTTFFALKNLKTKTS